MLEWIPFDRLFDAKKIGQGGFGTVYSATWLDGIRKIDNNRGDCMRARKPCSIVAFKSLNGNPSEFFNEETNYYSMVFQYADNGSLSKYLKNNHNLTWGTKLKLLKDISEDLREVHFAGIIHADIHSANILIDKSISKRARSYVSDLGISNYSDEIRGVLPYIAPEVLTLKEFTQAGDIYSLGITMSEMSIMQGPFYDHLHDFNLVGNVINDGLRPGFFSGTPSCYIELTKRCMKSNPQKRPTANDIYKKLYKWNKCIKGSDDEDIDKIKKQFLDADKIAKTSVDVNDSDNYEIFWLAYCYEYGFGVDKDENRAFIYYHKSADMNNSNGMYQVGHCYYLGIGVKMGKHQACTHFKKSAETGTTWCQTCDPDITIQEWTSGNKDIDRCIKEFQIKTARYENMIEWIPFDRLDNIKKIGEGGNGTQYILQFDISEDLREIHYAGYIHSDFHSGNVLQDQRISEIMQSYIADLGLSKKTDENSSDGIYGVIPYVAPEVLLGEKFTPAADVYGFGIIMTEMSTGQRPFDGYKFDTKLTNRIFIKDYGQNLLLGLLVVMLN
ncbi:kinase-like domain-containing protein [Gigaspora rosea]|uniref:Kinase-like domain-containing protein n=1 Tax=Gigaspora rosea TaxID=44941 RepID=A0A397UJ11_9GLOM|nr:kinase-like domain-containing protein [Gigaspora rosea]